MGKNPILLLLLLFFASCTSRKAEYYELVGGDPTVDYLELVNDSVIRFVSPSLMEIDCPYTCVDGEYVVQVLGLSRGYLHRVDQDHLQGEAPFFEGLWERRKPRKH